VVCRGVIVLPDKLLSQIIKVGKTNGLGPSIGLILEAYKVISKGKSLKIKMKPVLHVL